MAKPDTVLVTGASGYIAKHIVLQLLDAGWHVRGSVRSSEKADQVQAAMAAHVKSPSTLDDRLSFVELDLTKDDGWDAALEGVSALLHTASPFPMSDPKDEQDIIRPAIDGTIRALKAAKSADVNRIILTSSAVSVMNCDLPEGRKIYTEDDWTDIADPRATAYVKSKTLAEQAAWAFVQDNPQMQLTTINPSFVQGAPLDKDIGTSLQVVKRLLQGKDPALPDIEFIAVDVRDIAMMHVKALSKTASIGQRFIGVDRSISFVDMAKVIKQAFPDRKIVTRLAPHWLIKILGYFDPAIRGIVPLLGLRTKVSNDAAQRVLGIKFRDMRLAVVEGAQFLIDNDMVD